MRGPVQTENGEPVVGDLARKLFALGATVAAAVAAQPLPDHASTHTDPMPVVGGSFGSAVADRSLDNGQSEVVVIASEGSAGITQLNASSGSMSSRDLDDPVGSIATCDDLIFLGMPGFDGALRGDTSGFDTGIVQVRNQNLSLRDTWDEQNWTGQSLDTGDQFGYSLATGDFDGDGHCDLAIGAPFEAVGAADQAGAVFLVYGPLASAPTFEGPITQSTAGIGTNSEEGDRFGEVLARGPRSQGLDSLLVGAPLEDFIDIVDTGAAWWIPGSSSGLDPESSALLLLGQAGLPFDGDERFGSAFAVGDFNGDGREETAIGVPETSNQPGAVVVYPAGLDGTIDTEEIELLLPSAFPTATSAGLVTARGFGGALATDEWTDDGRDDLLIGAPRSRVGSQNTAGAVFWAAGSPIGPAPSGLLVQSDLGNQISESGDAFGEVLAVVRPYGSDARAFVLGVPGEVIDGARGFPTNEGVVHVVPTVGRVRQADDLYVESWDCSPLSTTGNCLWISELGDPTVDVTGSIAFTGEQLGSEGFVTEWPFQQAYGGPGYGFGHDAAISPNGVLLTRETGGGERLVAFDAIEGERTLLQVGATDGDLTWTSLGPFQLDADGHAFALVDADLQPGGQSARGIYRSTSLTPGSFSKVVAEGDAIGGSTADTVQDLLYTLDVAHSGSWGAMVEFDALRGSGGWGLVVDDTVVWRQGDSVGGTVVDELPQIFAINESSWTIGLPFVDHPIQVFDEGGPVFASTDSIQGRSLLSMDPYSMALNDRGDLVVLWTHPDSEIERFVSLSCAEGSPPSVLLAEGDRVFTDWSAATVQRLGLRFGTRPERTPQGTVHLHAEVWLDDSGPPFDTVLEIAAPCPLFYDGFESGDASSWSTTTP